MIIKAQGLGENLISQEELLNKIIELKRVLRDTSLQHWYNYEFGRWQWWLGVVFIAAPLYIWWRIVDRRRIYEIISYGLLVNLLSSFLDIVGSEFVLWEYPIRVLPNMPRVFPIDFIVVPVVYMIVYQKYGKWKQYIIVNIIVSFVFSFIAEPLLVWMNLYKLITWKYIHSFPIYIAIAIVCKWVINWFGAKKALNDSKA